MTKQVKPIVVKFPEPIHGYWDYGAKDGGEFMPDVIDLKSIHSTFDAPRPGPDHTIRWGCFRLNFWFIVGSGRSWREARAIAKRWLINHCKIPGATVE